MRRSTQFAALIGLLLVLLSSSIGAEEAPASFAEALRSGRANLDFRYRYETVSDDAVDADAAASTLRTVVGYRSQAYRGWSIGVEAEDVRVVGSDDYANAGFGPANNGVTGRPVVADPAGTAIHRGWIRWEGGRIAVQLGRDEINLGDQRFVGAVGWRQHHQSFDAATIRWKPGAGWSVFYGYLESVQRIFRSTDALDGHLLHVERDLGAAGKLTLYGYELDYDDPARWRFSSTTVGAEWKGGRPVGAGKLLYELEVATQRDAGRNPSELDAGYLFVSLLWSGPRATARAGWERLDGSAADGQFDTPLATLHKFNGWADKFLVTPTNGLVDRYLQVDGKLKGAAWTVAWHDFEAATGNVSYGSELDLQVMGKLTSGLGLGAKVASYDSDRHSTDTRKWIFWMSYSI